jgi:hypothetical protein
MRPSPAPVQARATMISVAPPDRANAPAPPDPVRIPFHPSRLAPRGSRSARSCRVMLTTLIRKLPRIV